MRFIKYHLPVIAYAGLIFYLSSIPDLTGHLPKFAHNDKLMHIVEFALFGALIWRSAIHWKSKLAGSYLLIIAILLGLLFGLSDELHQYNVPERKFDIWDILADTIGLAIGSISFYIFHERKRYPK